MKNFNKQSTNFFRSFIMASFACALYSFTGCNSTSPELTQQIKSAEPTNEEQYFLELINRARANPPAEGVRLDTTTDDIVSGEYLFWKSPTREKVQSDFSAYPVRPPLAFNGNLIASARNHSQDMLQHNYQGHTGSDGSMPIDRIKATGYPNADIAENIYAYGTRVWDSHATLQIDFGNEATLGHRLNTMNYDATSPVYSEIGIGIVHSGSGVPNVGPLITTQDFGDAEKISITGVVYNDNNHNGFYDIGEGIGGVTITVSSGSSSVSSASGGYAIPFSNAGAVTITASGGSLNTPISHQVNLNNVNVKVDFVQ